MEIISINDINLLDIGNTIQLGGMIWVGPNICFVTQVPQRKDDLSQLKMLPMTLEDWERFLRQLDILETEIFTQDPTGIVKNWYASPSARLRGMFSGRSSSETTIPADTVVGQEYRSLSIILFSGKRAAHQSWTTCCPLVRLVIGIGEIHRMKNGLRLRYTIRRVATYALMSWPLIWLLFLTFLDLLL
jgi:hypothetical protein